MKRRITFTLPYPGGAASSNHGYAIRRYVDRRTGQEKAALFTRQEARDFKERVLIEASQAFAFTPWRPQPGDALRVQIEGRFPNRRHADLHNFEKYITDALEDTLNRYLDGSGPNFNDRDWGTKCEPPQYERGCKPTITVTVEG